MKKLFISDLKIEKVRHLENIHIPLSKDKLKHLIITGKNGSGKTSILNAMSAFLDELSRSDQIAYQEERLRLAEESVKNAIELNYSPDFIIDGRESVEYLRGIVESIKQGISIQMNCPMQDILSMFSKGEFIVSYYKAERLYQAEIPKHVEKVQLKDSYFIQDTPNKNFVKYLLDLKMTEALATTGGKVEKAQKIKIWFEKFENLLQRIFQDKFLKFEFEEDTFEFYICIPGKERFDFNTLSSGYAAVLDIVVDIIIRMEKKTNKTFNFDIPGIVLIDEIETHLHLELQKKILDLLTTMFPNIQFVVSTHSPFILNSLENVVIYDLENHILVENGLVDIPYDGIVEGYFKADTWSVSMREKYERYKILTQKDKLLDSDFEEIAKLEMFLDEIPDYLALNITTAYRKLKLDFDNREDV